MKTYHPHKLMIKTASRAFSFPFKYLCNLFSPPHPHRAGSRHLEAPKKLDYISHFLSWLRVKDVNGDSLISTGGVWKWGLWRGLWISQLSFTVFPKCGIFEILCFVIISLPNSRELEVVFVFTRVLCLEIWDYSANFCKQLGKTVFCQSSLNWIKCIQYSFNDWNSQNKQLAVLSMTLLRWN